MKEGINWGELKKIDNNGFEERNKVLYNKSSSSVALKLARFWEYVITDTDEIRIIGYKEGQSAIILSKDELFAYKFKYPNLVKYYEIVSREVNWGETE